MKYQLAFDTTDAVGESIRDVLSTLVEAIVLVMLVIFIFLQDWRSDDHSRGHDSGLADWDFRVREALGFSINTLTCSASRWPPGVTLSFTPLGNSSVLAFQPIFTSSPTCAGTIRLIASSVRPSPVTAISTPFSKRALGRDRVQRDFVHVDQVLAQTPMFTFDQSVVGSASRICTTSWIVPNASCPGMVG